MVATIMSSESDGPTSDAPLETEGTNSAGGKVGSFYFCIYKKR